MIKALFAVITAVGVIALVNTGGDTEETSDKVTKPTASQIAEKNRIVEKWKKEYVGVLQAQLDEVDGKPSADKKGQKKPVSGLQIGQLETGKLEMSPRK